MAIEELLAQRKSAILQKWFQLILEAYPQETARFLKAEKDQFANPVGHTLYRAIEGLYKELLQGPVITEVRHLLTEIVRIKAVQGFLPSQAVAFLFLLKRLIREELAREIREGRVSSEELLVFDSRIDELALLSFDVYMECRERIYEIRVNEVKNRTYRLLQRANLLVGYEEQEMDLWGGSPVNQD